jgi:hypothetical protein
MAVASIVHHCCRLVAATLSLIALPPLSSDPARAGTCLLDTREIKIEETQSVRLRELRCRSDRDAAVSLSIQFQRLDEVAAGVLLNNGKAPWFDGMYPGTRVLDNEVLREYRKLIRNFGAARRIKEGQIEGSFALDVQGLAQPEVKERTKNARRSAEKVVETYELPKLFDMPMVDEIQQILKQPAWPENLNFEYVTGPVDASSRDLINFTQVWRYLNRADIDNYAANLKRLNGVLGIRNKVGRPIKAIPLLQYLTANGWPAHFLYASWTIGSDGCDPEFGFGSQYFEFNVDVVLMRNLSTKALAVSSLIGASVGAATLREQTKEERPFSGGAKLPVFEQMLQPGQALLIPLRLNFNGAQGTGTESADREAAVEGRRNAEARYQQIMRARQGSMIPFTIFSTRKLGLKRGAEENTYQLAKTRESFKPHTEPVRTNYAFGPEWNLTGIQIGDEKIDFERREPSFIALTLGDGFGSCPILYAWSSAHKRHERFGKVIHKAKSLANKQTETIAFDGWIPSFRLEEEELEVARLDQVRAVIRLADGSIRDLSQRDHRLAHVDGRAFDLWSGEKVDINFRLPRNVTAADVVETRLVINGHYDRYSTLLTQANLGRALARTSFSRH